MKAELSVAYADAAEFGYLSAWRKGEIPPLRWDAVDRAPVRSVSKPRRTAADA